jgi:uncharacterized membrane protein YpjA
VEEIMILWKRAVVLGFLSWFIPFLISLAVFPVKKSNAPLFSTLMSLILLFTAAALLKVYFRNRTVSTVEAAVVGTIWLLMNLALDFPLFSYGPVQMTVAAYYSEIGLAYLAIPIFALGAARLVRQ